jgi:hypothetical protein
MIDVCLIILTIELTMTKHLSRSILHSLWRYLSFLDGTSIYFTRTRSLILINLKVRSTTSSWRMHGSLHLISSHHSRVDRPDMTMTLLLLFWSWPRSLVCRIWIIRWARNFLLATTHLVLTSMIWALIIFVISSGLRGTWSHVHILLLLYAALITWDISCIRLILVFFQKLLIVTWRISSSIELLLISGLLFLTWIVRLHLSWALARYWMLGW